MVLMVLALAWGAVLVFWLRSRSQGSFGDSVGLFHRHLHVLERAAPGTLAAANRLRVPTEGPIPLAARMGTRPAPVAVGRPVAMTSGAALTSAARRRQTQRRRRDVLFVLVVAVVATLVAAVATGARTAIYLQLLSDVAFGGYIALLVRLRNLAAERQVKLRVLHQPQLARGRTAPRRLPSRSAMPAAYALAGDYGDLALRRAASN